MYVLCTADGRKWTEKRSCGTGVCHAKVGLYTYPPTYLPTRLPTYLHRGINDSVEDAQRLAEMTAGLDCVINLIEFNTHEGALFQPSSKDQVGR